MTAGGPIKREIFELETYKERLLNENEILQDEVNAVERNLISLKIILVGRMNKK